MKNARSTESKNLRIKTNICSKIGAKILRLASLAQDDRLVRLHDKLKFDLHTFVHPDYSTYERKRKEEN